MSKQKKNSSDFNYSMLLTTLLIIVGVILSSLFYTIEGYGWILAISFYAVLFLSFLISFFINLKKDKISKEIMLSYDEYRKLVKASRKGDNDAKFIIHNCYYYKQPINKREANKFNKKIVRLQDELLRDNYSNIFYYIGCSYYYGLFRQKNEKTGLKFINKGAVANDLMCYRFYAYKYKEENNFDKSFKYFTYLIEHGYKYYDAYFDLASFYEKGLGTKKDIKKAKELYVKAANAGNEQAGEAISRINSILAKDTTDTIENRIARAFEEI